MAVGKSFAYSHLQHARGAMLQTICMCVVPLATKGGAEVCAANNSATRHFFAKGTMWNETFGRSQMDVGKSFAYVHCVLLTFGKGNIFCLQNDGRH